MALVGVLAWPLLFTDAKLGGDWAHHLWLIWRQSEAIRADHRPSLFLNYSHGVLYPQYAFYGGTLYAIAGTLSLLLGNAPIEAYVATYLMGFGAAYGGWYWLARMAGLGRWQAQVPGLIFISSSYYLTLIYGRGDWPEFLGVSTIPLLIASMLSVLRADRLRLGPALALIASATVFFGGHSLTVIWGSTVTGLAALLAVAFIPQVRAWLTRRALLRVVALAAPALLLSAWFLLPTIAYQSHTSISSRYAYWRLVLRGDMFLVSARNLFTISRASSVGSSAPDFALSLPILSMGWALVGLPILLRHGLRGPWAKMLVINASLTALVIIVMTHAGLMLALPKPYAILQFSYRLESYVLLGVSSTVLAALVLARDGARRTRIFVWLLAPILAIAVIGAIQQTTAYSRTSGSRQASIRPSVKPGPREEGWIDYQDASLPTLAAPNGRPPEIDFSAASMHEDRASKIVHLRPGQFVYSDIDGGPEFVHVSGAKIVGINPEGNDVLEIGHSAASSSGESSIRRASAPTEVVSVSSANRPPVALGGAISLAAAILLIGEIAFLVVREARKRYAG